MKITHINDIFTYFTHNYWRCIIFYLLFISFFFILLHSKIYLTSARALRKVDSSNAEISKLFWLQKAISYSNHVIPTNKDPIKKALNLANISSQKNKNMEKQYLLTIKSGLENSGIKISNPALHNKINKKLILLKTNSDTTEKPQSNIHFSGIISTLFLSFWIFSIFMFTFRALNKKLELNIAKAKFWGSLYMISFSSWFFLTNYL